MLWYLDLMADIINVTERVKITNIPSKGLIPHTTHKYI